MEFVKKNSDGSYHYANDEPFIFKDQQQIPQWESRYETFGCLNATKSNVILIHHALSTHAHLTSTKQNPEHGWWEEMVGVGKPIDTAQYFVICINNLGSCFGSTGPTSINPLTGKMYQASLPTITIEDMVKAQKRVLDHLGIEQVFAMLGNSMGAMLSLQWAIQHPHMLQKLILTSSCYKSYPANAANRQVQRAIVQMDANFAEGFYSKEKPPRQGFMLARKHALLTYRSIDELNARFFNKTGHDSIENYLKYNASKFVEYFDANSYLYLLQAMDLFDVTQGFNSMAEAFARIQAKTLVVSVNTDMLYPPKQQEDLYQALLSGSKTVEYIAHQSDHGHDAFLVEIKDFGNYIQTFLTADNF